MTGATTTESFAVDGLTPDRVVQVATVDELSAALAEAHSAGEAVVPWGGGTRMHVGNLPERYTTAIDLAGFSANVEHEAGDLTLVADAGATIGELGHILAQQGQRLPFDVSHPDKATLGGSVASNAAGQARSSLGGIRDWVIGMKVVLADGTVAKSGGRVVKNVQGYDLHRLHTGAFGTLAVIAEVALKVVPIPADSSTVAAWFGSVDDAGEYAMQVFGSPAMPESLTVFAGRAANSRLANLDTQAESGEANTLVLAGVSGGARAVNRLESDLTGLAGTNSALGYEVLRGAAADTTWGETDDSLAEDTVQLRATLKPRSAAKLLGQVLDGDESGERMSAELQAGFGTVAITVANGTRADIDRTRAAVAAANGQAVVERCAAEIKQHIDVFGDQGTALSVMRSIKGRFDPKRILNPGRFAGRI